MEIIRPWKANRDDVHPTQFFTPQRLNKNEWPCLHSAWSFSVANSDSCLSFLSFCCFPRFASSSSVSASERQRKSEISDVDDVL